MALATAALSVACSDGTTESSEGGGGGTPSRGGASGSGAAPGAGPAPSTTSACGRDSCKADLSRGRAALESGDYAAAFEHYACADTAEAAFGAGLARVITILEGANVSALLADFGESPLRATDLLGSDGFLSREAARWNGRATLSVTGGVTLNIDLAHARQTVEDNPAEYGMGEFVAEDWQSAQRADFDIWFGYPETSAEILSDGAVLNVSFNCDGPFPSRTLDPRLSDVSLGFEVEGVRHWCRLPYGSTGSACESDGGSVTVVQAALQPGQPASYTLNNLLLSCTPDQDSVDEDAPAAEYAVRVSGSASATAVTAQLDTTDLHPLFGPDFAFDHTPTDRTGTHFVTQAGGALTELEEAACFFCARRPGLGQCVQCPWYAVRGRRRAGHARRQSAARGSSAARGGGGSPRASA